VLSPPDAALEIALGILRERVPQPR
jgi:hypothetical protein